MNSVRPEDVAFNWMPIHHVGGIELNATSSGRTEFIWLAPSVVD